MFTRPFCVSSLPATFFGLRELHGWCALLFVALRRRTTLSVLALVIVVFFGRHLLFGRAQRTLWWKHCSHEIFAGHVLNPEAADNVPLVSICSSLSSGHTCNKTSALSAVRYPHFVFSRNVNARAVKSSLEALIKCTETRGVVKLSIGSVERLIAASACKTTFVRKVLVVLTTPRTCCHSLSEDVVFL